MPLLMTQQKSVQPSQQRAPPPQLRAGDHGHRRARAKQVAERRDGDRRPRDRQPDQQPAPRRAALEQARGGVGQIAAHALTSRRVGEERPRAASRAPRGPARRRRPARRAAAGPAAARRRRACRQAGRRRDHGQHAGAGQHDVDQRRAAGAAAGRGRCPCSRTRAAAPGSRHATTTNAGQRQVEQRQRRGGRRHRVDQARQADGDLDHRQARGRPRRRPAGRPRSPPRRRGRDAAAWRLPRRPAPPQRRRGSARRHSDR